MASVAYEPVNAGLVGRTAELARIDGVLAARSFRGIALVGPAGVGKSRLADETRARGEAMGMATVIAAATPVSASITLGALAHLLPAVSTFTDLHAELQPAQLLQAAQATLVELAQGQPLMLSIDDAHQLDAVSAHLVHQLVATASAFVVITVRSGERVSEAISTLWKDGFVDRLDLQALPRVDADSFAAQLLGGVVDSAASNWLWQTSNGNALFLRELVLGGRDAGTLVEADGVWRQAPGGGGVSPRLADLVEARLAELDADERRALDLIALAEPLGIDLAERIVGADVLNRLDAHGLLFVSAAGYRVELRPAHPVYGEALRQQPLTLRRRTDLRTLIDAVESFGARRRDDAVRLAGWQLAAGGRADPAVLARAAIAAQYGLDDAAAVRLALLAIDQHGSDASGSVSGDSDSDSARELVADLRLCAGTSLARLGRWGEAEAILSLAAAAETSPRRAANIAMRRAFMAFEFADDLDAGCGLLDTALETLPPGPWVEEMVLLAVTVLADAGHGTRAAAELAKIDQRPTDTGSAIAYDLARTATLQVLGRYRECVEASDQAYSFHLAHTDTDTTFHPASHYIYSCNVLVRGGPVVEGDARLRTMFEDPELATRPIASTVVACLRARSLIAQGRIVQARAELSSALAKFTAEVQPYISRWHNALALQCDVASGRFDDAVRRGRDLPAGPLTSPTPGAITGPGFGGSDIELARAMAALATGDVALANACLAAAANVLRQRGDVGGAIEVVAYAVATLHDRSQAAQLRELAALLDAPVTGAYIALAAAVESGAAEAYSAAAEAFRALGMRLFSVHILARGAALARERGSVRTGTSLSHELALDIAACDGVVLAADLVGERVEQLTEREREIALLVAAGRSSKEVADLLVVSARTVDNHLQRVYTKLGISGRRQLASSILPE